MLYCQYCGRSLPNNSAVCECRVKPAFDDGGAAFPSVAVFGAGGQLSSETTPGLSLRDWFAGQALAPLVSVADPGRAASYAYDYADAMLAERAKRGK